MPLLDIPSEDRAGLAQLRKLSEESFAALLIELERSPDVASPTSLSPDEFKRLKKTVETMYAVRTYADVSVEELASDVCDALKEDAALPPGEEKKFRERLLRVLSIDALSVAAKALLLQNEHEHDFCTARILTDARPIYGEDPAVPPAAMIITHTLKLTYHQGAGGRLHEIYLSLGSHDLKELKDVIDRAESKAKSLRGVLDSSKMRFIDPQQ